MVEMPNRHILEKESADNHITIYLTDEANNTVDLNEVNRYDYVNRLFNSLDSIGYTVQRDELFVFKDYVLHSTAPLCCYGIATGNELPDSVSSSRKSF